MGAQILDKWGPLGVALAAIALLWVIWSGVSDNAERINDVRVDMERGLANNAVSIEKVLTAVSTEGNRVSTSIADLHTELIRETHTNREGIRDLERRLTNVEGGAP